MVDFSHLGIDHEIFSNEKEKVAVEFKIQITWKVWMDNFIWVILKEFAFKIGNDNKKVFFPNSRSKSFQFEEYWHCLFRGDYQRKCDK